MANRGNSRGRSFRATDTNRREFLGAVAGYGVAATFGAFMSRTAFGERSSAKLGYGELRPAVDETTGITLLNLPEGFRYRSFGWTGDLMADGSLTPADHDGMGVVRVQDDIVTIVRNHELKRKTQPFAKGARPFDPAGGGGCSNLRFNLATGEWLDARASLSGTVKNCAGGPTPWGTWLSCEESVLGPNGTDGDEKFDFEKEHGWIFEVQAEGTCDPVPLKAMGRFVHEAIAVDPETGIVYETEDRGTSGFYRFLPEQPGQLAAGGKLQMLKVDGLEDLRTGLKVGQTFSASWVDIEDVERAHSPGGTPGDNPAGDELGVFMQGKGQGAATFARLEGCWYGNSLVYLVSTSGGDAKAGQVWQFDPREQQLKLIFESPGVDVLDSPDNITLSPRGGLVLCEDGDATPHRLHGMTPDGRLFPFASNEVVLNGEHNGIKGDFRSQEWTGATFSPDGSWLFVNVQTPGITLAITGPWGTGLL